MRPWQISRIHERVVLEEADEHTREQPHNSRLRQRVFTPRLVALRGPLPLPRDLPFLTEPLPEVGYLLAWKWGNE